MRFRPLEPRETRLLLGVALTLALSLPGAAGAQTLSLLEDDYTSMYVEGFLPYRTTSLTSPHISVGGLSTIGGPTQFDFTANAPENWSPSEVYGVGEAELGALDVHLELSGPSAVQAQIKASFQDIYTVEPPTGVAPGTAGTMTYVYEVDGIGEAIGIDDVLPTSDFSVATVSVSMTKYTPDDTVPPRVILEALGETSFSIMNSEDFSGTRNNNLSSSFAEQILIDVPFEYGVPVALLTTLKISAFTDNDFVRALSSPYRELWGGGVIQSIEVETRRGVELVAIVNADQPGATVVGLHTDYSSLVTGTVPVPEPSARWLHVVALAATFAIRRWRLFAEATRTGDDLLTAMKRGLSQPFYVALVAWAVRLWLPARRRDLAARPPRLATATRLSRFPPGSGRSTAPPASTSTSAAKASPDSRVPRTVPDSVSSPGGIGVSSPRRKFEPKMVMRHSSLEVTVPVTLPPTIKIVAESRQVNWPVWPPSRRMTDVPFEEKSSAIAPWTTVSVVKSPVSRLFRTVTSSVPRSEFRVLSIPFS
jgi:hypothetical protein